VNAASITRAIIAGPTRQVIERAAKALAEAQRAIYRILADKDDD